MIIESGMIYSSVLVIEIVLYFLGDNAFYIVYDPIAQLTVRPQALLLAQLFKHHVTTTGIGNRTNHDYYHGQPRDHLWT